MRYQQGSMLTHDLRQQMELGRSEKLKQILENEASYQEQLISGINFPLISERPQVSKNSK